jgi:hypothetical protein
MVKLIGLDSSKLSPEFINDKFISFIPIIMIENDWMTQVHGIR